jgi:methylglutaconyl-CoA hydratase
MAITTQLSVLPYRTNLNKNHIKGRALKVLPFFCTMILAEIKDRIGIITLNRPEKRNAFSPELVRAMHEQVKEYNADPAVRAILFKGEGEAFSAGADLAYLAQLRNNTLEENEQDSRNLADFFQSIYNSPKLTYSAVDGYALAGGCGLATVTDFCIASEKAKFGYTEVMIGFVPAIVLVYLQRKISGTSMNKLLLTGKIIEAKDALDLGLISSIVSSEDFYEEVVALIMKQLSKSSAEAITLTKKLMRETYSKALDDGITAAVKMNAQARATEDCIRGVDAFLNKTKITW